MEKQQIIEMAPGRDGVYEPISEAKKRRAERIYNSGRSNGRRRDIQESPKRNFGVTSNFNTKLRVAPPVTFLEGFSEGLKLVTHAKREFERFLIDIMEG